jgi:hypothetical protein
MIGNIKALGLALVALLAMGVMAASSASAQIGKVTSDTNKTAVTLKGTDTGAVGANSFTVPGISSFHCPNSHYTGHKVNTVSTPLSVGETEITVRPEYTACTDSSNRAITVDMNSCHYRFYDATTTGGVAGTYGVAVDIVCPGTNKIEVTGSSCSPIKIGPQTDLTGFHLTNTPAGAIKDDVDLTGEVNVATTCFGIPATAVYKADVTMRGYNTLGTEIGVTISD